LVDLPFRNICGSKGMCLSISQKKPLNVKTVFWGIKTNKWEKLHGPTSQVVEVLMCKERKRTARRGKHKDKSPCYKSSVGGKNREGGRGTHKLSRNS